MSRDERYFMASVKLGPKGQIVIPKQCRDVFDIKPGDMLLILGDEERGIAIMKQEQVMHFAKAVFEAVEVPKEADDEGN